MAADVIVTRPMIGICFMQVCAHKDVETSVVQAEANRQNEAGTEHGWRVIEPGDSRHPDKAPVTCADDPDRTHFMLVC